jgi:hypothetical protein
MAYVPAVIRRYLLIACIAAAGLSLGVAGRAVAPSGPGLKAAVAIVKRNGYTPKSTRYWYSDRGLNALVARATRSGDGYDQQAFFFFNRRYLGTDAKVPSRQVDEIWSDGETIALMYVLYRQSDPNCCPTGGGKIVRFHWNGRRLIALDRIPTTSSSARIAR